jgi:hypothetical protein
MKGLEEWQIEGIRDEDARDGVLYRLKGDSDYFRGKYGTPNPPFIIKGEDIEIWEGGWKNHDGPACTIYGWRNGVELLPTEGKVYYGHVICVGPGEGSSPVQLGECVHESELEPIGWDGLELASSEKITFENSDPELNKGIRVIRL